MIEGCSILKRGGGGWMENKLEIWGGGSLEREKLSSEFEGRGSWVFRIWGRGRGGCKKERNWVQNWGKVWGGGGGRVPGIQNPVVSPLPPPSTFCMNQSWGRSWQQEGGMAGRVRGENSYLWWWWVNRLNRWGGNIPGILNHAAPTKSAVWLAPRTNSLRRGYVSPGCSSSSPMLGSFVCCERDNFLQLTSWRGSWPGENAITQESG